MRKSQGRRDGDACAARACRSDRGDGRRLKVCASVDVDRLTYGEVRDSGYLDVGVTGGGSGRQGGAADIRRLVEVDVIVVRVLTGLAPGVEGLNHHDDAEPVANVGPLRRWRVVGRPEGVDAHRLEDAHLAPEGVVVVDRAHRSFVVVEVDALELEVLSVQEDAVVRIEHEPANAGGRVEPVNGHARLDDVGLDRVQVRIGGRPQVRAV